MEVGSAYTSSLTTITEVPSPLSDKPSGTVPTLPVFKPGELDDSSDTESTTTSLASSVSSSYVTEIENYRRPQAQHKNTNISPNPFKNAYNSTDFSTYLSTLSSSIKSTATINSTLTAIKEKEVVVRHYKNGGKFVGEIDEPRFPKPSTYQFSESDNELCRNNFRDLEQWYAESYPSAIENEE